jgi:fibronectin type III domain protein/lectin-like protein
MGLDGSVRGRRSRLLPALALLAFLLSAGGAREARATTIPNVVYYAGTGHYYKWVSGTTTWANAKTGAQNLGGYLVSVTSAAEQQWLQANVIPAGQTSCLGGTDETTEGTWVWLSGEAWSYTYWNSGEPNNSGNEDYLAWNSNTTWNDIVGTSGGTSGYVVEWNTNPNIPPPPAAATNLAGVLGADNHVLLTWNDNSTNEANFELDRKTSAGIYSRRADPAANTTAFDDDATFPSSTYTYRLRAVNAGGVSAYTNEVTISIPATPTGPAAPSDLVQTASTSSSVTLGWTDNSDDETGFEVLRRNAAGAFQVVGSVGADVVQYVGSNLAPDASYAYRVRGVNGNGASGFIEAVAVTDATLGVTTVKADLKDSPKTGKDSLKLQAVFDFLPASDGEFDPVAEGITIRAGTDASPVSIVLPPNLGDWKVSSTKASWKSAKGTLPKYKVDVYFEDRMVKVSVTGTNLSVPAANPMRVTVGIGDDAGTQHLDWTLKKAGFFQFR